MEEWSVCLPDHHPGYVSWEEYLATRERLRANVRPRGEGGGAAREGGALLQGLVRCGRCGRRMQVAYAGNGRQSAPLCVRARARLPRHRQSVPDARRRATGQGVAAAFLRGGHPGRGRASTGAIAELEAQHDARLAGQRLALERASIEAERAERQFDACEPENRLVARTLEAQARRGARRVERERALAALEHAGPRRSSPPSVTRSRVSRATCPNCGPRRAPPTATARNCCAR